MPPGRGPVFHDFRHTNATLLVGAEVPIPMVADRMGHSRVSMTLDTYAHALPDMQDDAATAVSDLLPSVRDHDVTTDSGEDHETPAV